MLAVTLASLLPILAVEVMAIIISLTHPYDQVLREVSEAAALANTRNEPLINRWGPVHMHSDITSRAGSTTGCLQSCAIAASPRS